MRKKAHLLLSSCLLEEAAEPLSLWQRASFYVGSILPDCSPFFVVRRHEFDINFDLVCRLIRFLDEAQRFGYRYSALHLIHLGQVTHYLADYFTYPHNPCFTGTIAEHCRYEKQQLADLAAYLPEHAGKFRPYPRLTPDELISYIEEKHAEYLREPDPSRTDCEYIFRICLTAFRTLAFSDIKERIYQAAA